MSHVAPPQRVATPPIMPGHLAPMRASRSGSTSDARGVDDPGCRTVEDTCSGVVGGEGGAQAVKRACAASLVEAIEHPAHQPEHEAVGFLCVGAEPHRRLNSVHVDVGESCPGQKLTDALRVSQGEWPWRASRWKRELTSCGQCR